VKKRREDGEKGRGRLGGSVLSKILEAKRRRLAAGEFSASAASTRPDAARFAASLSLPPSSPSRKSSSFTSSLSFLCEIKHRSPSAGVILEDADARIEEIARAYRRGGAAALSVVVEQDFFGGDPAWLPRAKAASGLPVLMKDFVVDETQLDFAAALGADAVLLIAAALADADLARLLAAARSRGLAVLVEAHDEAEVRRVGALGADLVGVNARDLSTFAVDLPGMARLGGLLPAGAVRVAESGIRTRADVEVLAAAGFGAFLVGETLLRSPDPARTLRELRGENVTEVKICGITREEDVDACLENGVDWIGLIFAGGSPRKVTEERGRLLRMRGERGAVKGVVAVFDEDSSADDIRRIVENVRPDAIQMPVFPSSPSKQTSSFSSSVSLWNTVRVGRDDLAAVAARAGDALHFDTSAAGLGGGTGRTFDWSVLRGVDRSRPLVLAGGLTPSNVAEAVRRVRPDVADVASGVEFAPGMKDPSKIAAFVREVRRA
jgi:indole-3-glycerol phosphate synthase/phosphoribosylanthranilate isomerase